MFARRVRAQACVRVRADAAFSAVPATLCVLIMMSYILLYGLITQPYPSSSKTACVPRR